MCIQHCDVLLSVLSAIHVCIYYCVGVVIAMSFPASGVESAYRNNLKDVAKMLKTKHEENYMVGS